MQVTGTPLLRGRNFSAQDAAGGERVALVSESLARHLWPDGDGLGECLQYTSDGECLRVVGVIRGMRSPAPGAEEARMFLVPLAQAPTLRSERVLLVRTRAGERAALQQAVQTVRPGLAHVQVEPYSAVLEPMVWPWRLGARLFTAFGAIARILAAVGLYGIVAYDVTQREPEMSVRIALGAQRDAIARLIMGDAGRMILTGAAIGVGITWFVGPRLQALLFDVSGRDPRLLAVACIVLAAAGLGAAAVPAWRASRADPMRAMKEA
ncbi:MAG TPA: FtsX-like permease family protein [Longimicrobiales bacterium]|nr:FtsX-like permease family protein [Longimicrobiales bacterium]